MLEARLQVDGRELLQDHLDVRAQRETRLARGGRGGRGGAEQRRGGTCARAGDRVGDVAVRRAAYRGRGRAGLYPADGALNLPEETYSHGVAAARGHRERPRLVC